MCTTSITTTENERSRLAGLKGKRRACGKCEKQPSKPIAAYGGRDGDDTKCAALKADDPHVANHKEAVNA